MKVITVVFPFLLFCLNQALAKANVVEADKKSNLTTRANFNGTTVSGKYAHSPEANVQIENEKKLISLVKPRKKLSQHLQMTEEELHESK